MTLYETNSEFDHDHEQRPFTKTSWKKKSSTLNEDGSIKKNKYGNVDIRRGVPEGLTHVPSKAYGGRNIHGICRHLKIPCATALVGFNSDEGPSIPIRDGVVVPSTAVGNLMADLERRKVLERERLERRKAKQTPKADRPWQGEGSNEKGGG